MEVITPGKPKFPQYVVDWSAMNQVRPSPAPGKQTPSLRIHLSIIGRHWWKISLFVAAVVAATAVLSSRIAPMY